MVGRGSPNAPMPKRIPQTSTPPIDQLSSTPDSRSASASSTDFQVVDINGSSVAAGPSVGSTKDAANTAATAAAFTKANSTTPVGEAQLTADEKARNLAAVEARKNGILGCIGKGGSGGGKTPGCNDPCDSVDCLTKLLTGNLLDLDAKKLLCDVANGVERDLKNQIDGAGDSLLAAAQKLTSAQALVGPLDKLSGFVNGIDPGAVANCLGAQAIKDKVTGELNKAKNTIKKAEQGVHDKIAEKFNKATAALQQFSVTPGTCADKSPASLRTLF
jgi:hypothetical protein